MNRKGMMGRIIARNQALIEDLSRVDWWENSAVVSKVVARNKELLEELGGNLDYIFPTVNTSEDDRSVIVNYDIPGTDKNSLEVVLEEGRLRITGQRRDTGRKYRSYSNLPPNTDPNSITAKYEDGVLFLKMLKLVGENGIKRIEVQ